MIRQRLPTAFSALSLTLCIMLSALWARSLWRCDQWEGCDGRILRVIALDRGTVSYWTFESAADPPSPWRYRSGPAGAFGSVPAEPGHYGFGWRRDVYQTVITPRSPTSFTVVMRTRWVSYWVLILVTALLPATRAGRRLLIAVVRRLPSRTNQTRHALCRSCGYDLTGNTSGICPECGTSIEARPVVT